MFRLKAMQASVHHGGERMVNKAAHLMVARKQPEAGVSGRGRVGPALLGFLLFPLLPLGLNLYLDGTVHI